MAQQRYDVTGISTSKMQRGEPGLHGRYTEAQLGEHLGRWHSDSLEVAGGDVREALRDLGAQVWQVG